MADLDIDSLISELESALTSAPSSAAPVAAAAAAAPAARPGAALRQQPQPQPQQQAHRPAAPSSALSVDELLQSLAAEEVPVLAQSTGGGAGGCSRAGSSSGGDGGGGGAQAAAAPPDGGEGEKCTYLCLGASDSPLGATRSMAARRACPQLRCTACDFAVLAFRSGAAWDAAAADYLFFRNVFPDRARLGARLLPSPGAAAYCCQCSWVSVLPGDGLALVRRPGVGALSTAATGAEASSIARGGRVGGQGWLHWVCAGGHAA